MYALNQVGRAVLITPPEVLKKTSTNNNLDAGKILPAIEVAELRFVQDTDGLGSAFYLALAAEKNRLITSTNQAAMQALFLQSNPGSDYVLKEGDYLNAAEFLSLSSLNLWLGYLWKYVAECVHFQALPQAYVDFSSEGLMKNNPITSALDAQAKTSVGIGLSDMKYLQDTWLRDRIEPLRRGLKDYLNANLNLYPLWAATLRRPEKNTGYVDLSIYADEDDGRRCGCGPNFGAWDDRPMQNPSAGDDLNNTVDNGWQIPQGTIGEVSAPYDPVYPPNTIPIIP